jgi:hypothetical protein
MTPILFIVFNRPDLTRKVFEAIRQVKPSRLYVAADGPRNNKKGEDLKVREVREYLMNNVDWGCEVKTLFREKNLGCKLAVSSAIDWFFENEEEGIILEDDCLPDISFFPFCSQLLEKFRLDERIMMISGDNFQQKLRPVSHSYTFIKYTNIWGWASWRRAWKHYDVSMRDWPQIRENGFLNTLDPQERYYWRWCFDHVYSGRMDTWDYQWSFACWMKKGLAVIPAVNLISNIGFGKDGTHTIKNVNHVVDIPSHNMNFPLLHPENVTPDLQAEKMTAAILYKMSFSGYLWKTCKEIIGI